MRSLGSFAVNHRTDGHIGYVIGIQSQTWGEGLLPPFVAVHYVAGLSRKCATESEATKFIHDIQALLDAAIVNVVNQLAEENEHA
jgi:hypothetical protein